MEQRITFDFDFQKLTDFYLGGSSLSWTTCFHPRKLRKAAKRSRSEQLYVVLHEEEDEPKPFVVWKKYGIDPIIFQVNEVEDMIITTKPLLGGTKTVVKLVGEGTELLEIYSLQEPELFVETIQEMQGGKGGRFGGGNSPQASRPKPARVAVPEPVVHATTHIPARDPSMSEPRPIQASICRPQPPPAPPPSRGVKRQGSIGGEAFTNPLFAHGKIIYHLVLPEAVPPHLFYSRAEVEALGPGNANKPIQQLLQEQEQQRLQREHEDMHLGPSRSHGHHRTRSRDSMKRGSVSGLEQRLSTLDEDKEHQTSRQAPSSFQRLPSWQYQMRDIQPALPARPPSVHGGTFDDATGGRMDTAYQTGSGHMDPVRAGPLKTGLRSEASSPPQSILMSTNNDGDISAALEGQGKG